MKIRVTYIHKISPRIDQDTAVYEGKPEDLLDLSSVRNFLRRNEELSPYTKSDRQEKDNEGKDVFVFFPRCSPWHSIIVREEPCVEND